MTPLPPGNALGTPDTPDRMVPDLRGPLLGPADDALGRRLDALTAVTIGALTFAAYALDLFRVAGGVVILPWHATLVGVVAAAGVGYRGGGLAPAWLVVFAPLFGFDAEWAFLGLSGRSLPERLAFLFDPEGLAVFLVAALVLGTVGFAAGALVRRALAAVRSERRRPSS